MKREQYLDLMEKIVGAYSPSHIGDYFDRVKREGITEHGFPRLCADLGILIANGRKTPADGLFPEMMTFACEQAPIDRKAGTGNDFSVKELTFALLEAEKSEKFPQELTDGWRLSLSGIDPYKTYNCIAPVPPVIVGNWAAFAAASEQVRVFAGLGNEPDFIEREIASQMLAFDENGMYRDPHEPMLYDLVARLQLSTCLFFGYRGTNAEKLNALMKSAGLMTLKMQSVTGEIPFGGRSAQFLFNEAALASVLEYEAARYHRLGDETLASRFKAGADRAANSLAEHLSGDMRHIKNRYPRDSGFGCEGYGYFDKYMTTAASFLYPAILFSDDTVEPYAGEEAPSILRTSEAFHKVVMKNASVCAEYDLRADLRYDASGLGRLHGKGFPSPLCLTVPFPVRPNYRIGEDNPCPLSLCPVLPEGTPMCAEEADWRLVSVREEIPEAVFAVTQGGRTYRETCRLTDNGAVLTLAGEGTLCRALPLFTFDGEEKTVIREKGETEVSVTCRGATCTFRTDGKISRSGEIFRNRSGESTLFSARGEGILTVWISFDK